MAGPAIGVGVIRAEDLEASIPGPAVRGDEIARSNLEGPAPIARSDVAGACDRTHLTLATDEESAGLIGEFLAAVREDAQARLIVEAKQAVLSRSAIRSAM